MYQQFYAGHPLLMLPILAMLLFTAAFLAVVLRAARARPDQLARLAALPLDDLSTPPAGQPS